MVDERRVQQNPDGSQRFALVIAVARSSKGSRELVGTSLQHDGPGAHHFAAFASLVAFGAHAGCQRLGLGQSALAHDLPGAIHIGNQPGLSTPIRDPSRISKRGAGQHVLPGEGQVNKLKYIKRSMYGREKFELLRQRFLQAA